MLQSMLQSRVQSPGFVPTLFLLFPIVSQAIVHTNFQLHNNFFNNVHVTFFPPRACVFTYIEEGCHLFTKRDEVVILKLDLHFGDGEPQ